jgi:hypothetical protein
MRDHAQSFWLLGGVGGQLNSGGGELDDFGGVCVAVEVDRSLAPLPHPHPLGHLDSYSKRLSIVDIQLRLPHIRTIAYLDNAWLDGLSNTNECTIILGRVGSPTALRSALVRANHSELQEGWGLGSREKRSAGVEIKAVVVVKQLHRLIAGCVGGSELLHLFYTDAPVKTLSVPCDRHLLAGGGHFQMTIKSFLCAHHETSQIHLRNAWGSTTIKVDPVNVGFLQCRGDVCLKPPVARLGGAN